MLATYGVDVLDRRTSLRRISVLLQRLPSGSWPDDESPLSWSVESHLLASVFDAVSLLTYVTVRAAGGKAREPKPIPRPSVRPKGAAAGYDSGDIDPGGWAGLARMLTTRPGVTTARG